VAATAAAVAATALTVATRWTLAEAQAVFPALSELAEEHGFRLSMFGSVLIKGEGNDLDLHLVPFGSMEANEVRFLARFGGVLKSSRYNVAHGIRGFQVERGGKLYDFVFGAFWRPRGKA